MQWYNSLDAVYGVAYSLLLLNTDLHVAQGNSKMSRTTFVRNTMATIAAYSSTEKKVSEESSFDTRSIGAKSVNSTGSNKTDLSTMLKVSNSY